MPQTEPQAPAEASPSRTTVYRVKEHETAAVPLADLLDETGKPRLNPDVEKKNYFTVRLVGGRVQLQAGGFIGLIPLNERIVIDVVPRVPAANFSRLLRISRQLHDFLLTERTYETDDQWNDSLLDLYAETLLRRVEEIASLGLLGSYRRREDDTSCPRGRIRLPPTYTRLRARGIAHKVTSVSFERTVDNGANRCLRYALWFLANRLNRLPRRNRGHRQFLRRIGTLYEMLGEVHLDHSLAFLGDPVVNSREALPSLREYYRPALDIAVALIAEHAVQLEGNRRSLELPSLVLDMSKVFEDYLRNVLRARATADRWPFEVLDGNKEGRKPLFDTQPSPPATPDIVLRDRDRDETALVVEVKNVPEVGNSSRSAIQQAITYATSYRCNRIVLAHPRGEESDDCGLRLQGEIGDLRLYQYVFDLANASEAEDDRFCDAMLAAASA